MPDVQPVDVVAMSDVLVDVQNESDRHDFAGSIEMRNALINLRKVAAAAIDLIEMHMASQLEEGHPRVVDDTEYKVADDGTWRPDHAAWKPRVLDASCIDFDTGETITDPRVAAERAVDVMMSLFVAPAAMPKAGGLKKLRLDKTDIARYERTNAKKLIVRPAAPEDET